jgi:transposase
MSDSPKRRHFSAEQKAAVVRRHLAGKEPVSNLADELQVQPTLIHLWVKQVLEQAEQAFQRGGGRPARVEQAKDRRIEQLETKLAAKNEVIAELMEENVRSKKELGEL